MSLAERYAANAAEAARTGDYRRAALLYRAALLALQASDDEESSVDGFVQNGDGGAKWQTEDPRRSRGLLD
jgi:hypothetical protein